MRKVLVLLAVVALFGADDAKEAAVRKDREQLQGKWQCASMEFQGEKLPEDRIKATTAVVENDNWAVHFDTEVMKGTHQLDPTKKPKTFDGTITEGSGVGETIRGIYEVDGDTWRECWADPGKERPTEFKADATHGHNLVVWKRVKK